MNNGNFFDKEEQQSFLARVNKLTVDTKPAWGKMTSAQMMKHLALSYGSALDKLGIPRDVKPKFSNPVVRWLFIKAMPIPKNAPTAPEFLVKEDVGFDEAKVFFLKEFHELSNLPDDFNFGISPAFGKMDKKMWGTLLSTHTDFHLKQFGV